MPLQPSGAGAGAAALKARRASWGKRHAAREKRWRLGSMGHAPADPAADMAQVPVGAHAVIEDSQPSGGNGISQPRAGSASAVPVTEAASIAERPFALVSGPDQTAAPVADDQSSEGSAPAAEVAADAAVWPADKHRGSQHADTVGVLMKENRAADLATDSTGAEADDNSELQQAQRTAEKGKGKARMPERRRSSRGSDKSGLEVGALLTANGKRLSQRSRWHIKHECVQKFRLSRRAHARRRAPFAWMHSWRLLSAAAATHCAAAARISCARAAWPHLSAPSAVAQSSALSCSLHFSRGGFSYRESSGCVSFACCPAVRIH